MVAPACDCSGGQCRNTGGFGRLPKPFFSLEHFLVGKKASSPPNIIHATTAASPVERTWRAWKRSTNPRRAEPIMPNIRGSIPSISNPRSAAQPLQRRTAMPRFGSRQDHSHDHVPTAGDSSLEQYSGTDLPRLAGLQNGTCSSYLTPCPLGPKSGETHASCRNVDMAFGRRSLGCSGLQQTRAASQNAGRDFGDIAQSLVFNSKVVHRRPPRASKLT